MSKAPPNLPSVGDRVKLRGRHNHGMLESVTDWKHWAQVKWDKGDGPYLCHLHELEKEK